MLHDHNFNDSSYPWPFDKDRSGFPFAVYFNEEEDRLIAVYHPQKTCPDGAEIYDEEKHEGKLSCPDCSAKLHFNHGKDGKAGDRLARQSAHFKTNADSSHNEECQYRPVPHEKREYNDAIGYRVHLNLKKFLPPQRLHAVFQEAASIYYAGEKGRPKLKAEFRYLEDRRTFEIHTPKNFVTLLKRGNFERLKDTVFINQDHILSEKEFIIRYSRKPGELEARFINLHGRLTDIPQGHYLPCEMEFQIEKGVDKRKGNAHHSVTSKMIFFYQEETENGYTGRRHYIVPRALPRDVDSEDVENAFKEAGSYQVLGYVSLSDMIERGDTVIHYMDIKIMDLEQVLKVDLDDVLRKTLKRHDPLKITTPQPNVA